MVLIKAVKPVKDGWLYITFDNGDKKFVNMKPHMEGVLEQLKDSEFFQKVFVDPELKTVSWPGELDFDPDSLYKEGLSIRIVETLHEVLDNEKDSDSRLERA
jgi:hypothetical protein